MGTTVERRTWMQHWRSGMRVEGHQVRLTGSSMYCITQHRLGRLPLDMTCHPVDHRVPLGLPTPPESCL